MNLILKRVEQRHSYLLLRLSTQNRQNYVKECCMKSLLTYRYGDRSLKADFREISMQIDGVEPPAVISLGRL
jgi:hypothetical protein